MGAPRKVKPQTCCIDASGRLKRAEHLACAGCRGLLATARRRLMVLQSAPPEGSDPGAVQAPARGPLVAAPVHSWVPVGEAGHRLVDGGYRGRNPVRAADVFDRMGDRLSVGEIAAGRAYRDLTERVAAGNVKCSRLDRGAGSAAIDPADAYRQDAERLRRMQAAIGDGMALSVRRVRPSQRGKRSAILDRQLVDDVCIGDRTIRAALERHGWAVHGKVQSDALAALRAILARLEGI